MKTKAGYVSIVGKPNVGKSSLLNALLGQKLSITTNKPQTTRKKILGILSEENYQIIFLDTPGILNPNYLLQERMMEYVVHSVKDSDIIVFIVDASEDLFGNKTFSDKSVKKILAHKKAKKILVLNKLDLSNEEDIKKALQLFEKKNEFEAVVPISATLGYNVSRVLNSIIEHLPESPKFYPDNQLTDETERFFVSEIIREKIFELYKDEIPYSTEVVIDEFKEREGRKDYISVSIVVEKETQKPIIIGKKGEAIKRLGKFAREAIEEFLERPVFLETRVKVRAKWRSNQNMLKNFGYGTGDE